jgi:hypothetical protein
MKALKKLAIAVSITAVVGTAMGALSRVLMRLVTQVAGGEPGFSWSGTIFIVLIYLVAAAPVAALAAFTTRWWRWIAGVAGTALLAVPAASIGMEELGATSGFSAAQWVGTITLTVAILATTVALPIVSVRLVDRTVIRARLRQGRPSASVIRELASGTA